METYKYLEHNLKNVSDWLKFAEAKNAALIAFNAGATFGIIRLLTDSKECNVWITIYMSNILIFLTLSLILSLISFVPKTTIPWLSYKEKPGFVPNLLFFGHIVNYTPSAYLKDILKKTGEKLPKNPEYLEDIAAQIIVNSKIALSKYEIFRYAIWLTITAIATPIVALILSIIFKNKNR